MATARTSGRSADLSDNDEITKKAKHAIGLLEKPSLSAAAKADLIALLEEVIKSGQQLNQPETTTGAGQTNAPTNRFDAIDERHEEIKTITTMHSAKVEELKAIITNNSERTYAQVAAIPNPSVRIMR